MLNVIFWEMASVSGYLGEFINFPDDGDTQGAVSRRFQENGGKVGQFR